MKLRIVVAAGLACVAGAANGETLAGGHFACLSEELYDQMVNAVVKKDKPAIEWLQKNGCLIPKAGIQVSVLEQSWGTVKVRAYVGDQAVELWTAMENIVD
jgi:hypothetical protein